MKFICLTIFCTFIQCTLLAQCCPYMDDFEISPSLPCADQSTQLLTTVTTPNLGQYFGYEIVQDGNAFTINACYTQGFLSALQTFNEVVDFGIIPAGNYTYEYIAFLSGAEINDTQNCLATSNNQNQVVGEFIVTTCNNTSDLQATIDNMSVSCYGVNDGSIIVEPTGGTPPYQYAIDSQDFQENNVFSNLAPGTYMISVLDADNLTISYEDITIQEAELLQLECGQDSYLAPNEVFNIIPGVSFDGVQSINWTPTTGLSCPTCLETEVMIEGDLCYTLTISNENECTVSDEICFFLTTDVHEFDASNFQIFPNPVTDFLSVALGNQILNNYTIQILDIKTNTIFEQEFDKTNKMQEINVSELSNGMYLIQITSNSLIYTHKFVKI